VGPRFVPAQAASGGSTGRARETGRRVAAAVARNENCPQVVHGHWCRRAVHLPAGRRLRKGRTRHRTPVEIEEPVTRKRLTHPTANLVARSPCGPHPKMHRPCLFAHTNRDRARSPSVRSGAFSLPSRRGDEVVFGGLQIKKIRARCHRLVRSECHAGNLTCHSSSCSVLPSFLPSANHAAICSRTTCTRKTHNMCHSIHAAMHEARKGHEGN